jgi:hypothetical protein
MLVLVYLDIELILRQDRWTVCAECTIGSEIILDTPDEAQKSFWTHPMDLLGEIGYVESRFNPFGDTVRASAR